MLPRLQALELKAKGPETHIWDQKSLHEWLARLTGEQINVEVLSVEKKCFKVIFCTTDENIEAYRKLLESHFWVS